MSALSLFKNASYDTRLTFVLKSYQKCLIFNFHLFDWYENGQTEFLAMVSLEETF